MLETRSASFAPTEANVFELANPDGTMGQKLMKDESVAAACAELITQSTIVRNLVDSKEASDVKAAFMPGAAGMLSLAVRHYGHAEASVLVNTAVEIGKQSFQTNQMP